LTHPDVRSKTGNVLTSVSVAQGFIKTTNVILAAAPQVPPRKDRHVTVTPSSPRFEHHREALGIGERRPRLSWKTEAEDSWAQTGYEIEVDRDGQVLVSGRVQSAESVLVPWLGDPLRSRDRAVVRVRLWGNTGGPSDWSLPSTVEAGLLEPSDWTAVPVGPGWEESSE
jgi:alpha-L-rhamnosidase